MISLDTQPVEGPDSPLLGRRRSTQYITPSLRRPVTIDPAAPGTIIRYALAVEVILNLFMGTALVIFPRWLLSLATAAATATTEPSTLDNPISISICQWVGAIIYAFTVQVALVIPDTRGAIESRRLVYWTLLAGEGFLVPLFLYQVFFFSWGGSGEGGGFTRKFLVVTTLCFLGHALWRLFCLVVKPDWFGRYQDLHCG